MNTLPGLRSFFYRLKAILSKAAPAVMVAALFMVIPVKVEAAGLPVYIGLKIGQSKVIRGDETLETKSRMPLEVNDRVVVKSGFVTIQMGFNSVFRLNSDSEVVLASANKGKKEDSQIQLKSGTMFIKVKKNKRTNMRISTINTVAAVRGTEFVVEAEGGETDVLVKSGRVEVTNTSTDEKYMCPGGKAATVKGNQLLKSVLTPAQQAMMKVFKDFNFIKAAAIKNLQKQKQKNKSMLEEIKNKNK